MVEGEIRGYRPPSLAEYAQKATGAIEIPISNITKDQFGLLSFDKSEPNPETMIVITKSFDFSDVQQYLLKRMYYRDHADAPHAIGVRTSTLKKQVTVFVGCNNQEVEKSLDVNLDKSEVMIAGWEVKWNKVSAIPHSKFPAGAIGVIRLKFSPSSTNPHWVPKDEDVTYIAAP